MEVSLVSDGATAIQTMACENESAGDSCFDTTVHATSTSTTGLGTVSTMGATVCDCPPDCLKTSLMMPTGPGVGADCSACNTQGDTDSIAELCNSGVPMPPGLINVCGAIDPSPEEEQYQESYINTGDNY